jgi:hypothetical protein
MIRTAISGSFPPPTAESKVPDAHISGGQPSAVSKFKPGMTPLLTPDGVGMGRACGTRFSGQVRVTRWLDYLGVSRQPTDFGGRDEHAANFNLGENIVTLLELCPGNHRRAQQRRSLSAVVK